MVSLSNHGGQASTARTLRLAQDDNPVPLKSQMLNR